MRPEDSLGEHLIYEPTNISSSYNANYFREKFAFRSSAFGFSSFMLRVRSFRIS